MSSVLKITRSVLRTRARQHSNFRRRTLKSLSVKSPHEKHLPIFEFLIHHLATIFHLDKVWSTPWQRDERGLAVCFACLLSLPVLARSSMQQVRSGREVSHASEQNTKKKHLAHAHSTSTIARPIGYELRASDARTQPAGSSFTLLSAPTWHADAHPPFAATLRVNAA